MTLLICLVYAVFGLPAFRWSFRKIAYMFVDGYGGYSAPHLDDIVVGCLIGVCAALAWPLVGLFMLLERQAKGDMSTIARAIGGESREQREKRVTKERDEARRKIEALERELEVAR